MKAIVVGGGIGGLAAAIALARKGISVLVLERCESFAEIGAGIQLGPNSFSALSRLGVGEALLRKAVRVSRLSVRDGLDGTPLVELRTGDEYEARFGFPYVVVHREDILGALLERARQLPLIELRPGTPVSGYRETASHVTAIIDGQGSQGLTADVLVGADGVRSKIRVQLLGDGEPTLTGHTIYRSVIDMPEIAGTTIARRYGGCLHAAVNLWAGPDWHMVCYPISSGRKLNLALTRLDDRSVRDVGVPVGNDEVERAGHGACEAVHDLLGIGHGWKRWTLADRRPVPVWSSDRVVLVGDAAHPMLQYAAQGAGMAVEDAVLLGEALDSPEDLKCSLAGFVDARSPRTAATRNLAQELGSRVYHAARQPIAERNEWLRSITERELIDMVGWLHGSQTFIDYIPSLVDEAREEADA